MNLYDHKLFKWLKVIKGDSCLLKYLKVSKTRFTWLHIYESNNSAVTKNISIWHKLLKGLRVTQHEKQILKVTQTTKEISMWL